jgi:hypothetical protein
VCARAARARAVKQPHGGSAVGRGDKRGGSHWGQTLWAGGKTMGVILSYPQRTESIRKGQIYLAVTRAAAAASEYEYCSSERRAVVWR